MQTLTMVADLVRNRYNQMRKQEGDKTMSIVSWIIIGALSGWIASMITGNNEEMGAGKNIIVGVIGAFIGGFVFNLIGGNGVTGFNIWSLVVSVVGAVILLAIINMVRSKS